jgi:hypothetical protein
MMKEAARLTPDYVEGGGLLGSRAKGDNEGLRSLLVDGLHLTAAGYKVLLQEVLPFVGTEWAKEPFDAPTWIFPWVLLIVTVMTFLMRSRHWSVAPRIDSIK